MELIHCVGSVTGAIILALNILFKVSLSHYQSATGTRLGACCTGVTLGYSQML